LPLFLDDFRDKKDFDCIDSSFSYNQCFRENLSRGGAIMKYLRFVGKAAWHILPIWLFLLSTAVRSEEPSVAENANNPAKCEFIVEGKEVEKVILAPAVWRSDQSVQEIKVQSGVSNFLPAGNYTIQSIILRGGYQSNNSGTLTLSPSAPCKLEVGTPLKSTVKVKREGRILHLDYQLLDAQGRNYTTYYTRDRSAPPQFVVYQGKRRVGSGTFSYG
jgi:hypothetical protein